MKSGYEQKIMKKIHIAHLINPSKTVDGEVVLVQVPTGTKAEVLEKTYPGILGNTLKSAEFDFIGGEKYMMPLLLKEDISCRDLLAIIAGLYIRIDGKTLQGHGAKVVDLVSYEITYNESLQDKKIVAVGEKFCNGIRGSSSVAYRRVHEGKKRLELCLLEETPFFAGYYVLVVFSALSAR